VREVLDAIARWDAQGQPAALATVVSVWRSAPRQPGAGMAVSAAGDIVGSVSGGCVESAVAETAVEVMRTRVPRLLEFGVADEEAWAVGLSCGGRIQVFVEPVPAPGSSGAAVLGAFRQAVGEDAPVCRAVVVRGVGLGTSLAVGGTGAVTGSLGTTASDAAARAHAPALLEAGIARTVTVETSDGACEVFLHAVQPRPELVIFGAVHIAIALVDFARTLGFRTAVVDPRAAFATRERFAKADLLLNTWPDDPLPGIRLDGRSFVVVLSHDPKIDVPSLRLALSRPLPYIGALGSAATQRKRAAALVREGVATAQLDRLHAPIGLRIGARTPEEIALAILAEIVAVRRTGSAALPAAGATEAKAGT
jgi:xanthine dehydrogenase accessory factor